MTQRRIQKYCITKNNDTAKNTEILYNKEQWHSDRILDLDTSITKNNDTAIEY